MEINGSFSDIKMEPNDSGLFDSEPEASDECFPRRKQSHILAEQKRRDAIKRGYDSLLTAVPGFACSTIENRGQNKVSKAQVLQKSLEYIQYLLDQKKKQDEELEALDKEMKALEIMKENYEQLVKDSQVEIREKSEVSEEDKLTVFLRISEYLWTSYKDVVSISTFSAFSSTIFGWLEKYCKPNVLKDSVVESMRTTFSE